MLSILVVTLVWMIVFHFYIEAKFDRLRSDLLRFISLQSGAADPNLSVSLPQYHAPYQQMSTNVLQGSSLLPTAAEIAPDVAVAAAQATNVTPPKGLLPAYENGDVYAQF